MKHFITTILAAVVFPLSAWATGIVGDSNFAGCYSGTVTNLASYAVVISTNQSLAGFVVTGAGDIFANGFYSNQNNGTFYYAAEDAYLYTNVNPFHLNESLSTITTQRICLASGLTAAVTLPVLPCHS